MTDDFSADGMHVRMTERLVASFTDPRGAFGSGIRDWRPEAQPAPDKRREAWAWIARQWELWPRPDLMLAILPPAIVRTLRRARR